MITVLVVDDHTIFRQGIVSLLNTTEGVEAVAEAGSGSAAVALAKDLKPQVILMDVSMPDMDGIEAARRIRAAGVHTRVILLTMHRGPELLELAADSGIRGFLLKNDAFSDLLYAIKAVVRGERFVSSSLAETPGERPVARVSASPLTPREAEIVALIADGLTSKEIAEKLVISVKTVETHRANVMEKLGVKNVPELVRYAIRAGVIKA
ncbi:MAG: DNA-binding response regulator [Acidobacteria bacterium]|nr:MAG: DNA-binding response regulator [Acidobacteriota bacterium]